MEMLSLDRNFLTFFEYEISKNSPFSVDSFAVTSVLSTLNVTVQKLMSANSELTNRRGFMRKNNQTKRRKMSSDDPVESFLSIWHTDKS